MLLPRQLTASVSALKRCAVADVAGHLHVGQEAHLDGAQALPFAGRAAAVAGVEGEARRRVAARLGLQRLGEELADRVPEADVGGRAGARRLADRRLVDLEHAVDRCQPSIAVAALPVRLARRALLMNCRLASSTSRASVRLARAADAGDRDQALQRHGDVDAAAGCAATRRAACSAGAAARRPARRGCSGWRSGCARKRPVTELGLRRQVGRRCLRPPAGRRACRRRGRCR